MSEKTTELRVSVALALLFLACACWSGMVTRSSPAYAAQAPAIETEGCLNQAISNGSWQVRVTKVARVHRAAPFEDIPSNGWAISFEWTNVSGKPAKAIKSEDGTVVTESGAVSWNLAFPSGSLLGINDHNESAQLSQLEKGTQPGFVAAGMDQTGLTDFFDQSFPPGVTRKGVAKFWTPKFSQYAGSPTKFLVSGEPYVLPHFGELRFKLNCTK